MLAVSSLAAAKWFMPNLCDLNLWTIFCFHVAMVLGVNWHPDMRNFCNFSGLPGGDCLHAFSSVAHVP